MKNLRSMLLLAFGLALGASPAWSVPMFARMYNYNCSTCHDPGYGQLNKFGYNFRAAGYRIPKDIGKDMNDGKFELGNYIAARFSAGGSVKTTEQPGNVPVPDSASLNLGGDSIFLGGGISKHFFSYSELGLGNGTGIFSGTAPSLSSAKIGYVTGSEDDFFTVRVGKFGADGFAGSDRGPIGNATIAGVVKPTGTGVEIGYTHQDFRVTLAVLDGVQNAQASGLVGLSGKPVTVTNVQAPASDSNNAKDLQIFVNQFIGDDGMAVNATFYNGYNDSGTISTNADIAGQEYYNMAVFFSSPIGKSLGFKAGAEMGQANAGLFATNGGSIDATGGFFGELDYSLDELTPVVFRWDSTTTNFNVQYADTEKFTLGALTPLAEGDQIYMNPTYTLTMTNAAAGYTYAHSLSDSLYVFF